MKLKDAIELLRKADIAYENGKPIIPDGTYDKIKASIFKAAPSHEYFNEVGGLGDAHEFDTSVKHKVTMGSLHKKESFDEFKKWFNRVFKDEDEFEACLGFKIDGLSLSLTYVNGKLDLAATRGNGKIGKDVTRNAIFIKGIPQTISDKEIVEIRGEVYKNRFDFFKNWVGEYKTPRNFAAGAIRQKEPKTTAERDVSFCAYEVVRKSFATEKEKLEYLEQLGFEVPQTYFVWSTKANILDAFEKHFTSVNRDALTYDIDGFVFKLNDISKVKEMGYSNEGRKPKAHMAIKFPTSAVETVITDVKIGIGTLGQGTFVAHFEPRKILGCTHDKATMHNVKFIKESGIKIGSKVLIEKRGDIIPYIAQVLTTEGEEIIIPDRCPSCGSEMILDKNNVNIWCQGTECDAMLAGRVEKFFKKLNIKGIGGAIAERIVKNIKINEFSELFEVEKVALQAEFGDRQGVKIYDVVHSVTELELKKLIEAMGIGNVGRTAKDIMQVASTVEDIDKLVDNSLSHLDGWGDIKSKKFVDGWKKTRSTIEKLLKHISIKKEIQNMNEQTLAGKKMCFTGKFSNPSRKEMEAKLEELGGKKSSVSKNLNYLVWDGEIEKGKYTKATKLGIPIISQKDFLEMIK